MKMTPWTWYSAARFLILWKRRRSVTSLWAQGGPGDLLQGLLQEPVMFRLVHHRARQHHSHRLGSGDRGVGMLTGGVDLLHQPGAGIVYPYRPVQVCRGNGLTQPLLYCPLELAELLLKVGQGVGVG